MASDKDVQATSAEMLENIGKPPTHDSHVDGDALLLDKDGNVRKVPIPSNNPNDPLNWKPWERWTLIGTTCWFSIMSLALSQGLSSMLKIFFVMYGRDGYGPKDVAYLLSVPSLCIGLGNFIILPVSLAFGRRPIFLISSVIVLAATIGCALSKDYPSHLGFRALAGIATGATESLLPLMLTEVTFLHERGFIFGLYWTTQNVLSSGLNLASSYEAAALGWRWYYWIFVIAVGVGLVLAVLFGFETKFSRPAVSLDGRVVMTDEFGVTHIVPDDQAQEYIERHGIQAQTEDDEGVAKKSYKEMIKPWTEPHPTPVKVMINSWIQMAQSLTSPAILYVVLASSIVLGCIIGVSLTFDTILQQYGWNPKDIGLINLGGVFGGVVGAAYCSLLGEPFVMWMAKRNHGIHKPEHRLIALAPVAVLGFSMLLLYGFMATKAFEGGGSYWGIVLAWSFYQVCFTAVLIVTSTFASEASPKHPGPALVMVVGTKNVVSFGITFAMTPMVDNHGYTWTLGVLAGIFGAIFILGIPVYILNPKWRKYATQREAKQGVTTND